MVDGGGVNYANVDWMLVLLMKLFYRFSTKQYTISIKNKDKLVIHFRKKINHKKKKMKVQRDNGHKLGLCEDQIR